MGAGVWACRVMLSIVPVDWQPRGLPFCCIGAVCARGRTAVGHTELHSCCCAAPSSQHVLHAGRCAAAHWLGVLKGVKVAPSPVHGMKAEQELVGMLVQD